MATITGSFSDNNNNVGIYITWSSTQNVNTNKSTVTAKLYVKRKTSYATTWKSSTPYSITVNGETLSDTKSINVGNVSVGSSILVATKTVTVSHNTDGTKSIKISGKVDFSGCNPGKGTVPSTTVTLPTIPRQTTPTLSATSVTLGNAITINLSSRASSSYTHTLRYVLGSSSGTIVTKTSSTSYSWTTPASLASALTSSTSGTLNIYCKTYSGSTQIGNETKVSLTAIVPSSANAPSVSATITAVTNAQNSAITGYYKGISQVKVTINATAKNGASISSYKMTVNGATKTSTSKTITSAILSSSGTFSVTVSATDSRGLTGTASAGSITVNNYSAPTITTLGVVRKGIDEDGNLVEMASGDRIIVTTGYSFSSSVNSSYRTYKLYYGTTSNPTTSYSIGSNTSCTITGLTSSSKYYIKYVISDGIKSASKTVTSASVVPYLHFNSAGLGLAVGGYARATSSGIFDVNWAMHVLSNKIYMGGDANSKKEKNIYFNTASGGTYSHDCKIYGGNAESTTGIGLWDNTHSHGIMTYNDQTETLSFLGHSAFTGSAQSVYNGKSYFYLGELLICWGHCEYAEGSYSQNTDKSKAVTFSKSYAYPPCVIATKNNSSPAIMTGVTGVTTTGFDMRMTRTNTNTASVNIFWLAIGYRA